MIKKLLNKRKEVGLKNLVVGTMRKLHIRNLRKKYNFDSWHDSPYELRKYAQAVAEYISSKQSKTVVDIGCGLGEVLRHVRAEQRIGYDLSENCIAAAKKMNPTGIDFRVGSFDELGCNQTIDYVITLGFMHGSKEDTWQSAYTKICTENDIKHVIVDTLPAKGDTNCLDFTKILPKEYQVCDKMGPFLGGRYVYVYEKKEDAAEL